MPQQAILGPFGELYLGDELGFHPVDAAAVGAYLRAPGRRRLVLSKSSVLDPGAAPGFRTNAEHHGDFDDDEATRESLTEFLRADAV